MGSCFSISATNSCELAPPLATLVEDVGAAGRHQLFLPSPRQAKEGASAAEWMVVAAGEADLAFLASEKRWQPIKGERPGTPWTDDFSNIFSAMIW